MQRFYGYNQPQATPQQVAAQEYKDKRTEEVIKQIENIDRELKPKGFLLEDPMQDATLWAGAALMAGGGAGYLIGDQEEEDNVTITI